MEGRESGPKVTIFCDFLEMLLITSACPLNLSSTGFGGTFFKTPAGMLIFSSSASSNNAAHDRCLALTLIKRC